jgi:Domain of unknown function (DUF1735)
MKKIFSSSLLLAALAVAFAGCLKDKGFDNHTYGINDPDTQPPGVGFPLGVNAKNGFGLNVTSDLQKVNGYVFVNLESGNAAKSDVHITLIDNTTALLSAYLVANGLAPGSIIPLPSNLYNVNTSLIIHAGKTFDSTSINVTNTITLNPNQAYCVGFTISAVDGGYKIAGNLKDLFMVFSIKNRLDGMYSITGAALRFGDPVLSGTFGPYTRALATSGPNTVTWQGTVPWANGSGSALPAGYESILTIDPVSNLATGVTSANGLLNLTSPVVRTDILEGTQHRYNPATKTLYWEATYTTAGNRLFSFKAVYTGPRP